jgi:hypothetical protein
MTRSSDDRGRPARRRSLKSTASWVALLAVCLATTACAPSTDPATTATNPETGISSDAAPDADAPVGKDLAQTLPAGDADRGAALAQSRDCLGCHRNLPVGPLYQPEGEPAIGARAAERIESPDYTGQAQDAEQYLLESIVDPEAYVVDGFPAGLMPDGFAVLLTRQQAADLIAYLLTLQ